MKSFSQFVILEGKGKYGYGITHVEDLPVEEFIRFMKKLHSLEAVQKLDGANLVMGRDTKGALYSSREQKGGKRFYELADFPDVSAFDGFRAAHAVMKKNHVDFEEHLKPGQAVNCEIIYGAQPNTVFYGKDMLNYIGLLELQPGDDPSLDNSQKPLKELYKRLKDKTTTVKTNASDTFDGETMARAPRLTDWKFTISDPVPKDEIDAIDIKPELRGLEKFLDQANETAEALGRDLTNYEVLKDKSRDLTDERTSITEKLRSEYMVPVKEKLLELVKKQKPSLRGEIDDDGAYDGIEGIIFTDPETREKFKVVDREVFTQINKFNYGVRNSIATKIVSTDPDMPIEQRGGLVGEAKVRAMKLLGIQSAEIPSQTKKMLEPFKGDTREETINNLLDSLHQLNFQAIRKKIQAIYINALDDVEDALNAFKTKADEYELDLPNGKKIKYTKEIKRRTLMLFADTKDNLFNTLAQIKKSDDLADLIEVFFGPALDGLEDTGQDYE